MIFEALHARDTPEGMSADALPRVSVILTVYNRKEFLSEALESALAQSFRDFEIIVVDDSGNSASRELVSRYDTCDHIRYVPNPATLGVIGSIARGVDEARGDLIAILNDDDIWEEHLLEELVGTLAGDPKCVAAFSDHCVIDESGQIDEALSDTWSANMGRSSIPGGLVRDPAQFVIECSGFPIANCAIFRKDAVDWSLLAPEVSGAYDYWISCLLAASGGAIYYVPKRLARYRVHPKMETKSRGPNKGEEPDLHFFDNTQKKVVPESRPEHRRNWPKRFLWRRGTS